MGLDDYNGIRWEEIDILLYHHLLKHNQKPQPPPPSISNEEYLEALKVVEGYYKQLPKLFQDVKLPKAPSK